MKVIWILFLFGIAVTLSLPILSWEFSIFAVFLIFCCFSFLVYKLEGFRRGITELNRLKAAYEQLDQQAKLMIKTDLELHQTQEKLDRRLASFLSLHTLGQDLQLSVGPEEVFNKLTAPIVTNFGFSKGLLGMCRTGGQVDWKSVIGIDPITLQKLTAFITQSKNFGTVMAMQKTEVIHLTTAESPLQKELLTLLDAPLIAFCPIKPQTGLEGILILGKPGSTSDIQADEDLVAILVNYLEMTIENASLFEDAWQGKQVLEKKVKERTQELDKANKALMALNDAKTNFVSAVSHELRTPLAAIKGYASLLVGGSFGTLEEKQLIRLQKIEKHADLLTQLINNMLDIARIESGRVTMDMTRISTQEFFSTVIEMIKPQMDEKSISFSLDYNGIETFEGDPQQLQRVFMNLISNAIKYTPENGSISVELKRNQDRIEAQVRDSGHGIAEEDLPRLFDEFFRSTDPINATIRGTGLGLSLVKRIVEAHHGTIRAASEKGRGSTFYIEIPAQQSEVK